MYRMMAPSETEQGVESICLKILGKKKGGNERESWQADPVRNPSRSLQEQTLATFLTTFFMHWRSLQTLFRHRTLLYNGPLPTSSPPHSKALRWQPDNYDQHLCINVPDKFLSKVFRVLGRKSVAF